MHPIPPAARESISRLRSYLGESGNRLEEVRARSEDLAREFPDSPDVLAEIGEIFDSNDFEHEALGWYERARSAGLDRMDPGRLPHFHVWYGSTLRNVGRAGDSERVLRQALARWPRFGALQFFLALSLMTQGRSHEAFLAMGELTTGEWDDSLAKYRRAAEHYLGSEFLLGDRLAGPAIHRLLVDDVAGATAWYARVLRTEPTVVDDRLALFDFLGSSFAICAADGKNPASAGGSVCYWNARPFEEWVARFEEAGATVYRGPLAVPGDRRICQVRDPFGGIFGLVGEAPT